MSDKELNSDAKDSMGSTPLQMAAARGNVEVVKLLLATYPDVQVVGS